MAKDEVELLNAKVFWTTMVPAFILIIIGIATLFIFVGIPILLIGLIILIGKITAIKTCFLRLTNKRIYLKTGLFKKEDFDIRLKKIDGCSVKKDIIQSLFGCGSIEIRSSGSNAIRFGPVKNPQEIRQKISDAIDIAEDGE